MDGDNATRFVASLVKSIQALCNGYIDFSTSIEVIGHIHLNIDRSVKLDYVLTEEVSKSVSEGATVFASHSYHSHPPSSVSSKNSNDSSKSSRQKQSVCVTQGSEADPLGFSSSVPLASSKSDSHSHARSSSHFVESSDSSHADNFVDSHDTESVKQEKSRTSFQVQESQERRRRSAPSHSQSQSHRTTSPAAKRIRHTDSNPEDFEVVEIKEEPDDEPAVFFGDSSSHMAAGQDLQTPDFSSVVMESLDRVGQVEGTKLVASGDGAQMQQPPFPVMMHSNTGMPSSSVSSAMPGPSLSDPQAQSLASTSGGMAADAPIRRQGYKFYSQEDIARAVGMVHEGFTLMEADKVTGEYMSRPLRRYVPGGYRRYKKADVDKAIKLVHEGATFSQAGTATRVPPSSIRRVLLKCTAHPGPCRGAANRPGFQWQPT